MVLRKRPSPKFRWRRVRITGGRCLVFPSSQQAGWQEGTVGGFPRRVFLLHGHTEVSFPVDGLECRVLSSRPPCRPTDPFRSSWTGEITWRYSQSAGSRSAARFDDPGPLLPPGGQGCHHTDPNRRIVSPSRSLKAHAPSPLSVSRCDFRFPLPQWPSVAPPCPAR